MQLNGNLVFFNSEDKCVPLVPILELEEKKFLDFLESAALLSPIGSECMRTFPKELLLRHVFHTSFSGYWPERALAWLETDKSLHPLFKDELEKFMQNKVMPQGARQKAKRMVQSCSRQPKS
ncbi:MAG: hypothetical protein V4528_07230 [Pseudomonadota bacterium]